MTLEQAIVHTVANHLRVTVYDMTTKNDNGKLCRANGLALARQVAIYLYKKKYNSTMPLKKIPEYLFSVSMDHSTVLHSINTVENLIQFDRVLREKVEQIKNYVDNLVTVVEHKEILTAPNWSFTRTSRNWAR